MAPAAGLAAVPELGPWLGRLTRDPEDPVAELEGVPLVLDDLRLALVTALFAAGAEARARAAQGDLPGAAAALAAARWRAAWDEATDGAAARVIETAQAACGRAGAVSRASRRRIRAAAPADGERPVIAGRLRVTALPLLAALDRLEAAAPADATGAEAWLEALALAARKFETAWESVERETAAELAACAPAVAALRAWRRPRWPVVVAGLVALAAATWFGLMVGGWLPVPDALRPVVVPLWDVL